MNPTLLLAIAAAHFVSPAIYILTASMLSQQDSLGAAALPGTAEAVFWAFAGISLLAAFAIRKLLRSFGRSTQLLITLVVTLAASVFGLVLSFTSGHLGPVRVLGIASMLAILGWSWVYRECFRTSPLEHVVSRYTTILILLGVVCLAFAAFRTAFWEHAAASASGPAPTGFAIFMDTIIGVAALATALLRRLHSAYARSATQVLSWALLPIPLLATLTSLYWIYAVRKREQLTAAAHAAQQSR